MFWICRVQKYKINEISPLITVIFRGPGTFSLPRLNFRRSEKGVEDSQPVSYRYRGVDCIFAIWVMWVYSCPWFVLNHHDLTIWISHQKILFSHFYCAHFYTGLKRKKIISPKMEDLFGNGGIGHGSADGLNSY